MASWARVEWPVQTKSSPTASRWRQVGREWHLFGGKVDLYYNILARRRAILADPNLSDEPIPLTVA